jgi:hypothetical protein
MTADGCWPNVRLEMVERDLETLEVRNWLDRCEDVIRALLDDEYDDTLGCLIHAHLMPELP